jgi:KEOPS complex subunit Cgi121
LSTDGRAVIGPIQVFGARGEVDDLEGLLKKVTEASDRFAAHIQLVDATKVYGKEHLEMAARKAIRAFKEGRNFAKTLPVEVLLYASGKRQISEAMGFMGVHPGRSQLGIVAIGMKESPVPDDLPGLLGLERDDAVLDGTDQVLDAFGISREARSTVPKERWPELVLEKVAMLDVEK